MGEPIITSTAGHRPRPGFAVAAGTVALLVAAGCMSGSAGSPESGPPLEGGTFKLAVPVEITSFNPYSAIAATTASFLYDSLVNVTANGDVVSGLASTWTASATSASFTLRRDVTCADGTALTAKDVAASLTYAGDPNNQLTGVNGFLPDVPFRASADDAAGTVRIDTSSPFGFLVQTVGVAPIICPAGLQNPKSLDHASNGTGPYVLSSYRPGGPYVFTLRKGYRWGPGGATTAEPGTPATIKTSVVPNSATVTNLLLDGDLNATALNGPNTVRVQQHGFFSAEAPVVLGFAIFNQHSGHPTSDPVVRKALITAVDRQQLANVIAGGAGTPAQDLGPRNADCHADLAAANLPRDDAAQVLQAGGWTAGSDGIRMKGATPLRIRLVTGPTLGSTFPPTAELMARMWKSVGIDTQVISEDVNGMINDLYQKNNFDVVLAASAGRLPSSLLKMFSGPPPPHGRNLGDVHDVEYSSLTNEALKQTGPASCVTWNQAAAALLRNSDVLPIADGTEKFFGNKATFSLGQSLQLIPTSIRMHK